MSSYIATSLFFFNRVEKSFFKIEDTDLGSVYFVILISNKRFTPIYHECESKAEGIHA